MSLFQFIFLRKFFRKNRPGFSLPSSVYTGERFSSSLEAFIPFICPGFRCLWVTELFWEKGSRAIRTVHPIKRGSHIYEILFSETLRGVYRGLSGFITIEDLFGFTRFSVYIGDPLKLYVLPVPGDNGFTKEKIISGGEAATADYERIRSDELLEVRKYYPGDDARRINWKMYASTGELYFRIGEEVPPPSGEVSLLLDCWSPEIQDLEKSSDYTDALISSYLIFIYSFIERGCIVQAVVPSSKEPLIFNPEKPDDLLRVLADITSWDKNIDIPDSEFIYAVCHPRSDTVLKIVEKGKTEIKVFIKNLPEIHRITFYGQFLFRNKGSGKIGFRDFRKLLNCRGIAEEDLMILKNRGREKFHGEII